ncbi:MAG TPA: glycosyltransferase [Nitrospira sp.]|nr:glycosyltransferase [Nitrospira sp.]
MNRGGAETWLMHVLRAIDRDRFHMDFLVHTDTPAAYDEEIVSLGSQVLSCLSPSRPWIYARNFARAVRHGLPYDVIHSHVHHYSGFILRLAHRSHIPIRLAHSHNDTSEVDRCSGWARRQYLHISQEWIRRYATTGVACSAEAGSALFSPSRGTSLAWRTLPLGIDLASFEAGSDRGQLRSSLGIPTEAFVIGHVGRFMAQKNHHFLVDILLETVKRHPLTFVILVGDGPLRSSVERKIETLGLTKVVRFLGLRSDVPELMLSAMDALVLPSLHEGFPVVLLEAQAAGLPCVVSDVVTAEVDVVNQLVSRVALQNSPAVWADAILATRGRKTRHTQRAALDTLWQSPYSIQHSVTELQRLYTVLAERHVPSASRTYS